jgi:hypothetical protein
MGKTVKVTDLTKLEGDPDPRKANVRNVRMYLEMHARAPWQVGFVKFVARCSEHAPVARALVVSILLAIGIALAALAHFILTGVAPGWVTASVSLGFVFVPTALYWITARMDGGSRG